MLIKFLSKKFSKIIVKRLNRIQKGSSNRAWLHLPIARMQARHAAKQGLITLPSIHSISETRIQKYITGLNERNKLAGYPVKIQGDLRHMELIDWLDIEFQLQKHEILSAGPTEVYAHHTLPERNNAAFFSNFIMDDLNPIYQFALYSSGVPAAAAALLVSAVPASFAGWQPLAILSVFAFLTGLFNFLTYRAYIRSGKMHDALINDVSPTWKDVLDCKSYADATLLTKLSQVVRNWPEGVPLIEFMAWKPSQAYEFLLEVSPFDDEITEPNILNTLREQHYIRVPEKTYLGNASIESFQIESSPVASYDTSQPAIKEEDAVKIRQACNMPNT